MPFRSRLHDERLAAVLGVALGVAFAVCFLTGLLSHLVQDPPSWFRWPPRPAGLYRVTQGLHVATGLASVPLLLAKLWVAYPRFWGWPPVRSVAHAVERVSLVPLVGGSLFLLLSGVGNVFRWRPWAFSFTAGHFWVAWLVVGGLVVHVGATWATTARVVGRGGAAASRPLLDGPPADAALDRRGFLAAVATAAGAVTVFTVGQTVRPLERLALVAPRRPSAGPQGVPVNTTASGAGVVDAATAPAWRLSVTGAVERELSLSIDDLRAMPQREATLPIACVEGWSSTATWRGVPVRDVLAMAGAADGAGATVASLQDGGIYRTSDLSPAQAADPDTLLALDLGGEPLHLDHGFPLRLIGPNRPGVQQTKWLSAVVVR
ncbi:MAG TPA: molybdopterin-dependent oxidoreductase [Acidimicrobiales bacterium]|jgi:DMSO/TMAO reductase YedYZ molybdopterin-dependent catalytic subunit